ncbi:GAF domain-containing protein [Sphingomonas gellani]|uniref:GAF domain-containing protein n=1 Tax=Sphingomonas gellani TaxID=1166340 RepID=A0A1H8J5M3_9SPHN|nr:GAF domain-containing protein [Sphingomonas gellani]SEN76140.1 GAF domain-containing protein [Sphingomonas gellani]
MVRSRHQLDEAEKQGLSALAGYGILDTPNEPEFDAIVKEAARTFDFPIALISLLDENRQWFKAKVGLEPSEIPRSISFCTHAVRGSGVFSVADTTQDERFASNPLVTGSPNIRSYAGAPLKTSNGSRVGTLCVIDTRVGRSLTPAEQVRLEELANRVVNAMERRRNEKKSASV